MRPEYFIFFTLQLLCPTHVDSHFSQSPLICGTEHLLEFSRRLHMHDSPADQQSSAPVT